MRTERGTGKSIDGLEVGFAVSLSPRLSPNQAVAAIVTQVLPTEIVLEFPTSASSLPFQEEEQVRIKYWGEGVVLYYWDGKVVKSQGHATRGVAISVQTEGVTVQRRTSHRLAVVVPLSFTVIDAAETELVGKSVMNVRTKNISVGGLAFETSVPLKVGDKLDVNLQLSGSEQMNVAGWVVRSEPTLLDGKYVHLVGLMFLPMATAEQRELLEFLLQVSK